MVKTDWGQTTNRVLAFYLAKEYQKKTAAKERDHGNR